MQGTWIRSLGRQLDAAIPHAAIKHSHAGTKEPHVPWWRLKIPHAAIKTWDSQINYELILKCRKHMISDQSLVLQMPLTLWKTLNIALLVHLPMQETQVRSLIWKDATCHRATKPRYHRCWTPCSRAWEPQLLRAGAITAEACSSWSLRWATREAATVLPESSPLSLQLEQSPRRSRDPGQPEINNKRNNEINETIFLKRE